MRPLPLAPLQAALSFALKAVCRRHPDILERLGGLGSLVYVINPTDLPVHFVLRIDGSDINLRAERALAPENTDATIHGPINALMALLGGEVDGDALFFSRTLSVEGDTEAVLALRNAVDAAEVDLFADVARAFGPFAPLVTRFIEDAKRLYARAEADLSTLQSASLQPAMRESQIQAGKLKRIEKRLDAPARPQRQKVSTVP